MAKIKNRLIPIKFENSKNILEDEDTVLFANSKKLDYVINIMEYFQNIPNKTILKYAIDYFYDKELDVMYNDIFNRSKSAQEKIKRVYKEYEYYNRPYESIFEAMYETNLCLTLIYRNFLTELHNIKKTSSKKPLKSDMITKIDYICGVFSLNKTDREILIFLYLYSQDISITTIYDNLGSTLDINTGRYSTTIRGLDKITPIITKLSKSAVSLSLAEDSPLTACGLLESDKNMATEVINYLEGRISTPFKDMYFTEYTGKIIPLDKHTVDKKDIEVISKIIKHKSSDKGINILLYGLPGTGKTEFSRTLSNHLGKKLYEIKNTVGREYYEEGKNRSMYRHRALTTCQKMVDPETSIILVDEADELLNTMNTFLSLNSMEKGQINKILDNSKNVIVWVTNRSEAIEESTMRRFDYSVEFNKLTFSQRKSMWETCLEKNCVKDIFTPEDINNFITNYEISAGGIDLALRNISKFKDNTDKVTLISIVENIIKAHVKVTGVEKSTADIKKPNSPSYSLDGLNIKADIPNTIKLLERFNKIWTGPVEAMPMRNMNILLYGPPGTGKTEFAKFVARSMDRRLVIKQASDLLSCWVGETEKIIKGVFQEAEKDKAILFIDEADSMLGSREGASHSWEITSVNEMLTNIETFTGMLICSTNFKKVVDSAAIRRFNVKLEFDYLTSEGALKFYEIFLTKLIGSSLNEKDKTKLSELCGLTPGDFKVVYQKYLLFEKNELSDSIFIEGLEQELIARDSKNGKCIGFSK